MGRQSLQPQEAYPPLLLLLFYNELLKPSFPSLPWAEGVQRWGLPSLGPDSHAQAPRVAALRRGGGIGRTRGAVGRFLCVWLGVCVCVCVVNTVLTADRWGQNVFFAYSYTFGMCTPAVTSSDVRVCVWRGALVRVWAAIYSLLYVRVAIAAFCHPETLNVMDNVGRSGR